MLALRQKFTLKERDIENGLDFFEARYYGSTQGRFTSVDPSLASAKAGRPESWNRYAYCYNRPLTFVDPDGMDVDILDEKAKQRVLSTLPEEIREKVKSKIDKNGRLKAGSLNGIKSDDANFQDLKAIVNAKGTLEVMTSQTNPTFSGNPSFFYRSDEKLKKEIHDNMIKSGASEEEAKEFLDSYEITDKNRGIGLGATQGPDESPSRNFRVVVSDGTGDASDAPEFQFAVATAHEMYVHGLAGVQGQPWKHEVNPDGTVNRNGPINVKTGQVENRTRAMYKKPPL